MNEKLLTGTKSNNFKKNFSFYPQDILEGLKNTKKHDVVRHSADYMAVAESILMDDNGVMKGYADRRKPPGKTSYMYEFNRD